MSFDDKQLYELDEFRCKVKAGSKMTQDQIDDLCNKYEHVIKPTNNQKEILIPVDTNDSFLEPIIKVPRWLCHLVGIRHRCVHIVLKYKSPNIGNVIILQVRNWDKKDSPGHIDVSASGHVKSANSCEETAYNEMSEELGLFRESLCGEMLKKIGKYIHYNERVEKNFYNAEYRHVYCGIVENLSQIKFNDKEVVGIYLCPEYEVDNILKQKIIPIASSLKGTLPIALNG